jgi:hypothetical protein
MSSRRWSEDNPYASRLRDRAAVSDSSMSFVTGRARTDEGPGLLGADLDAIARHHHSAGRRAQRVDDMRDLDDARAEAADAFAEGRARGREDARAQDYRALHGLLLGLHFELMKVEQGSKSKAYAALGALREAVNVLLNEFDEVHEQARARV